METSLDHSHLLSRNSPPPSPTVQAIAVTLTETKRAIDAPQNPAAATNGEATDRLERIAVAAYYLAERRGFAAGHEMEDWFAAEQQVVAQEARGGT